MKRNSATNRCKYKGLGACLLQEEKPIYFASKALTETQRGYIAIEIESLAVAWAVENSITSYTDAISHLKLIRNHLK